MALKDKLVDLEDLKALKDWIAGRIDMWDDITSSLTWSSALWVAPAGGDKNTTSIIGVKVARIAVNAGERYRCYGWCKFETSYTACSHFLVIHATDANDNLLWCTEFNDNPNVYYQKVQYKQFDVTVPSAVKYLYIFDYGACDDILKGAGQVIVKKAL